MSPVVERAILLILAFALSSFLPAQDSRTAVEREYPFPVLAVEECLREMNAATGARLPSLDGFIATDRARLPRFERPYYEYKIEVLEAPSHHTRVRVRASISAWYTDPNGHDSGYQALVSNGRLETDLLDRLGDFLAANGSKVLADSSEASRRIAEVEKQQKEAAVRISEFETKLRSLPATDPPSGLEFVTVIRPRVRLFNAPDDHAPVVLRAEAEDEFQVLEHRGSWDRVKLSDQQSGWLRQSQVEPANESPAADGGPRPPAPATPFEVIRENVSNFSGEWERLREKEALYLWARPQGSAPQVSPASKLEFVESLFGERYREASHSSASTFQGIVVVFLDQGGGVAAASLEDIGRWLDGNLAEAAFLKRCSFDPPSEFRADPASRVR